MSDHKEKLVVVLNKKIESGKAMNALAHAMLGFGVGVVTREDVKLNQYIDADGNVHGNISEMPIVVLQTKPSKLHTLRQECIAKNLKYVDFTESMTIGTYEDEYELTKTIPETELQYYAIIVMGPWDVVTELTKKFSLYR